LNQITSLIDRGHEVEIISLQRAYEAKVHPDVVSYGLLQKTHYVIPDSSELGFEFGAALSGK
jgi:colanic acid/amylovoran biosynthesis glycosyltransferase